MISYVARVCNVDPESLNPTSQLSRDLELEGDWAKFFIVDWMDEFGIDFGDFEFSNYFVEEFHLLSVLRSLLFPQRPNRRYPITIEMLVTAANAGTWDSASLHQMHDHPTKIRG